MKISIIYHSETGNTAKIAQVIKDGLLSVGNFEVGCFNINDTDKEFIIQSKCVIIGSPTYSSSTSWQLKKWFDEESKEYQLAGKLGCAYATANFIQGGADTAIQSIINHMLVRGMLVYSSGSALGKPYVHLGAVEIPNHIECTEMFYTYGQRIGSKTLEIFK